MAIHTLFFKNTVYKTLSDGESFDRLRRVCIAVSSLSTLTTTIDLILACLAAKKREAGKRGDIYFQLMEILVRGMAIFRVILPLTKVSEILGVIGGLAGGAGVWL